MNADSATDPAAVTSSASNTLSQLAARILDQLSLSAWLPSAALTLLVAFIFQLAHAVDAVHSPAAAFTLAFTSIGASSIGSFIVIAFVIVVVTMLTQAFSFEAIRVMEGYWATFRWTEAAADFLSRRSTKRHQRLTNRYNASRRRAWHEARPKIVARQQRLAEDGKARELSDDQIDALESVVLATPRKPGVTLADAQAVVNWDWEQYASAEARRRQVNALLKRDDYPEDMGHMMPTRLGCVLRRYEDQTGHAEVEQFVEEHFDALPFWMQLSHDEQRARLELYCSMVFVLASAGVVAVFRFGAGEYPWLIGAVITAAVGCRVVYRASIASARYYGAVLVGIAQLVDKNGNDQASGSRGGE